MLFEDKLHCSNFLKKEEKYHDTFFRIMRFSYQNEEYWSQALNLFCGPNIPSISFFMMSLPVMLGKYAH